MIIDALFVMGESLVVDNRGGSEPRYYVNCPIDIEVMLVKVCKARQYTIALQQKRGRLDEVPFQQCVGCKLANLKFFTIARMPVPKICKTCSIDIAHLGKNRHYCDECQKGRKEAYKQKQREITARNKKPSYCLKCGKEISCKYGTISYCGECRKIRNVELQAMYNKAKKKLKLDRKG